jgi:hypothetical protein
MWSIEHTTIPIPPIFQRKPRCGSRVVVSFSVARRVNKIFVYEGILYSFLRTVSEIVCAHTEFAHSRMLLLTKVVWLVMQTSLQH